MKELSIEEKAKRYDEVIEKLRNFYRDYDTVSRLIDVKEELANLIPELKESEDERIRKELIRFFRIGAEYNSTTNDIPDKDIVAWLEKQGEQKTLCDKCRKEHPSHSCQDITELGRCALEKQNEQKPGVKIKPKFHEGEWVILTAGELSTTLQIGKVDTDKKLYWFNDGSYLPVVDEECLHRWTIKDAKAGDVLVTVDNERPFMYKGCLDPKHPGFPVAYCGINTEGNFFCCSNKFNYWWTDGKIRPATKDERNILMKAMADARWKFNFDKKELKKIKQGNSPVLSNSSNVGKKEQKSADKTESIVHNYITPNPQFFQWIYNRLIHIHNENPSMDYMLSLKERVEDMQKSAWSVEDEDMLDNIIDDYDDADEHNLVDDIGKVMWLKSLKQRMEG